MILITIVYRRIDLNLWYYYTFYYPMSCFLSKWYVWRTIKINTFRSNMRYISMWPTYFLQLKNISAKNDHEILNDGQFVQYAFQSAEVTRLRVIMSIIKRTFEVKYVWNNAHLVSYFIWCLSYYNIYVSYSKTISMVWTNKTIIV